MGDWRRAAARQQINEIMSTMMKAARCPTEDLSLSNCAVVNKSDFNPEKIRHVEVRSGQKRFVFTITASESVTSKQIGFSAPQRKWATITLNQELEVVPYQFDPSSDSFASIVLEADFLQKKNTTTEPYDSDKMAAEFLMQSPQLALTRGQ